MVLNGWKVWRCFGFFGSYSSGNYAVVIMKLM